MALDKAELVHALESTLVANDHVIDRVIRDAEKLGSNPYDMQNRDGTYAMAPLLHTRAMVLSSLVALRTT